MHRRRLPLLLFCAAIASMAHIAAVASPLVLNGGFEQGAGDQPEAWAWDNPSKSLQTEWTQGIAHTGQRALHVRVPGEFDTSIGWSLTCTAPVPVEPGDYIASFWLKAACDRLVLLSIDGYNGDKLVKSRLGG